MNLRLLEILTSLGVLISVVVLIFEVRESTVAIQRSAYDQAIEAVLEWRYITAADPEFSAIAFKAIGEGLEAELTDAEKFRFQGHMSSLWLIYDRAFWANEYGQMGEMEWERFTRNICQSLPPKDLESVFAVYEKGVTKRFSQYVRSTCPQFREAGT